MTDQAGLLLVGGGHAHLEVLRRFCMQPVPSRVLLISAYPKHHYSGMVPGFLAGQYPESLIAFDLAALCRRAGAGFLRDRVVGLDASRRFLITQESGRIPYQWVSFNIGSRAAGSDRPEIGEHAQLVKPMSRAVQLQTRVSALAKSSAGQIPVHVVGGGAAGVEVVLALDCLARSLRAPFAFTLWEAGAGILIGYPRKLRRLGEEILSHRGIEVRTRQRISAIGPDSISLSTGQTLPSALAIWLTGPAAWPLFRNSGLEVDEGGFLQVDKHLRSVSDTQVFGAGDCVTPVHRPETPKAGVYAVREAPVLWKNLSLAVRDRTPSETYDPQPRFLSILNTCDGRALLDYHGWVSRSRWAWWLKDWIDRRFVNRYHRLIRP